MNDDPNAAPNALRCFPDIARQIGARELAVFLDYDGTLTPIVARPELAVLSDGMRETLDRLSRGCTTAIISGRACADVRALVGLDALYYAGNHGLEIEGPSGMALRHETGSEFLPEIAECAARLDSKVGDIPGALVEDKRFSLSVHYRLVEPGLVPGITADIDDIMTAFPRLHTRGGKKVIEIRPRIEWHKGKALRWLLEVIDGDPLPVYIGDDKTDEDAFRAIEDGLAIRVGELDPGSAARYVLTDTDEVGELLGCLADLAGGGER